MTVNTGVFRCYLPYSYKERPTHLMHHFRDSTAWAGSSVGGCEIVINEWRRAVATLLMIIMDHIDKVLFSFYLFFFLVEFPSASGWWIIPIPPRKMAIPSQCRLLEIKNNAFCNQLLIIYTNGVLMLKKSSPNHLHLTWGCNQGLVLRKTILEYQMQCATVVPTLVWELRDQVW